jgi:lipoprotein LprG
MVVVAVAVLGLAACSGDDDEPEPTDGAAQTTAEPTPEDRLEQAREVLTDAGSVSLTMEGSDLPEDLDSYIIKAVGSGSMEPPAFEGTITAKVQGIQADVPTVAVDGDLYVQLPFTPGYITTSPEDLNVPDPAKLFDVEEGVVSLLTTTEDPEFGEQSREGREIVQQITGTLPGGRGPPRRRRRPGQLRGHLRAGGGELGGPDGHHHRAVLPAGGVDLRADAGRLRRPRRHHRPLTR